MNIRDVFDPKIEVNCLVNKPRINDRNCKCCRHIIWWICAMYLKNINKYKKYVQNIKNNQLFQEFEL
jgi:hypothetical protein